MACISPNTRRVGYIVSIHGPLDGDSIHELNIHQHVGAQLSTGRRPASFSLCVCVLGGGLPPGF